MKFKTSVSLMIAVVMGLVTAYVGVEALKKSKQGAGAATKLVVAARDMEPGYVVDAADLKLEDVAVSLAPSRSFKDPKLVAGRTVLASVVKGYPLLDNQLAAAGAGAGMQAMVPKGMRAVAVDVSEGSAVAGLITPGCFVDVIATLRMGEQTVARTVVQNVKVQFVQRSKPARSQNASSAGTGAPDTGVVKTVTLLVSPKQANALELANSQGKPRLVLRGNDGGDDADNTSVSERELLGLPPEEPVAAAEVEKPAVDESTFEDAPPPVQRGRAVTVIQGSTEKTIYFDEKGERVPEDDGYATAPPPRQAPPQRQAANGKRRAQSPADPSAEPAPAGDGEPRTASGASPDVPAPRTDAGDSSSSSSGNLRKGM